MTTAVMVGSEDLIVSSPDFREGKPCVAGTGITVMRLAGWYRLRCSPEKIANQLNLSYAQVYAALAYYHANREAIDADLDDEAAEYDRLAAQYRLKREQEQL
ncbi:MAG TPA: DUF433 domain-containing protein [Blastocatellia bacterium]|nr:DUF433 domain-containing protein [Blastocatellia bacterium]HMV83042.1 DUF433 domain-containing protein [Blastocatellia bacterium]HMX27987.1 DUF433 domain-containing protein [Blastocatellia bacterium]HMY71772.1 DUF433 domain-containing protein [Blastocatellia bacterium]HMZ17769.1 DUF433 domain-containing protein [Blastocatellia bacterium]